MSLTANMHLSKTNNNCIVRQCSDKPKRESVTIKNVYWLCLELEHIGKHTASKILHTSEFLIYSYAIAVQIFMQNTSVISAVNLLIVTCKSVHPVALGFLH